MVSSLFTDEDTEAPKEEGLAQLFSLVSDRFWVRTPYVPARAVTSHHHMLKEMMGNAQQI